MLNFGRINNKSLFNLIGLQPNHKIVSEDGSIKYVNESNMYGQRTYLKSGAIKVYLALHFFPIDQMGFIKNVDTHVLADAIGCERKTVITNLQQLSAYGYIMMGGLDKKGCSIVCITDYKNNFLSAKEGGRGYLLLDLASFKELSKIKNINALRIYLRRLSDLDKRPESAASDPIACSYDTLKRALPGYCNRSVVQKALSSVSQICSLFKVNIHDTYASFDLKMVRAKSHLQNTREDYRKSLIAFLSELEQSHAQILSNAIKTYISSGSYPAGFKLPPPEMIDRDHTLPVIALETVSNLTDIAVQYGDIHLKKILRDTLFQMTFCNLHISNLGAYVRTMLQRVTTYPETDLFGIA